MTRRVGIRIIVWAGAFGVIATCLVSTVLRAGAGVGDFYALYEASRHALDARRLDELSMGYYPPSARPILMLLALVPAQAGAAVWCLAATALHLLSLYLVIWRFLPRRPEDPILLAGLVYLLSCPWLMSDLSGGNCTAVILGSVVIGYELARRRQPAWAGLVLSVGIAVKLIPALLVAFWLVRRRWRAAGWSVVFSLALGILPGLAIFGGENFAYGWRYLRFHTLRTRSASYVILQSPGKSYVNQALPQVLLRALHPVNAGHHDRPYSVNVANVPRPVIWRAYEAILVVSGLVWLAFVWPRRGEGPQIEPVQLGSIGLAMIWLSPHVMSYYLPLLLPATAVLAWAVLDRGGRRAVGGRLPDVLLGLYLAGCVSVASPLARAYGSYLGLVVVLFIGLWVIVRRLRGPAGRVSGERAPGGSGQ